MMPELPPEFIQTIQNAFGGEGKHWLESLPALLAEACSRWNLTDIQLVPNLSYNFVASALRGASDNERSRRANRVDGPSTALRSAQGDVVLKLGIPHRELTSEIAALQLYNGRGACRLLDADAEKGMLLLERLQPGRTLAALKVDIRATEIAADVMKTLWTCSSCFEATAPAPVGGAGEVVTTDFIFLKDWFDGFKRLRQRYNGKTGPLPEKLVETAELLSKEFLAENKDEMLLHGDFHHSNVLESARGWLAIDPKGVIGPCGYEVGPFLINPVPDFLNGSNPIDQTEKRIAILSEMLGMERERIRAWGICHAVLSAWWSLEDGDDWEYAIRCAEIFQQVDV